MSKLKGSENDTTTLLVRIDGKDMVRLTIEVSKKHLPMLKADDLGLPIYYGIEKVLRNEYFRKMH